MKKEEQELKVTICGEIDLHKLPKEIYDAFFAVLTEEVFNLIEKDSTKNKQ